MITWSSDGRGEAVCPLIIEFYSVRTNVAADTLANLGPSAVHHEMLARVEMETGNSGWGVRGCASLSRSWSVISLSYALYIQLHTYESIRLPYSKFLVYVINVDLL